jgi:hypothetical protein
MTGQRKHAATWSRLLICGALLGMGACASNGRDIEPREAGAARSVLVTVENQNFKDAVIYALWGAGPRDRLGMVTGNTTQTLSAPFKTGDLRIEVDFIAGDDVVSHSLGVFEGEHVHVTIPPSL